LFYFKNDILKIISSNEPKIIQKHLGNYLILLQNRIGQYTAELMAKSTSCPSTLPPLKIIHSKLKKFVRLLHLNLSRTIDYQIVN